MTVGITPYLPFAAPTLSVQLASGGSLDANTTYYYRMAAVHGRGGWQRQEGLPSNEVSITTTDTDRTAVLTWTAVTDNGGRTPQGYAVFRRKSTQSNYDFYGSFVYGPSGNFYDGYTVAHPTLTYTDNGTGATYFPRPLWAYEGTQAIPFDKTLCRGYVEVAPDANGGSVTIDQIHAAVGSPYSSYDGHTWILQALLHFKNGGPITFAATDKIIHLANGIWSDNVHANTAITFGALDGNYSPYNGCAVFDYASSFQRPYVYGLRLYDTRWTRMKYGTMYQINPFYWLSCPSVMMGSVLASNVVDAWIVNVHSDMVNMKDTNIHGIVFFTASSGGMSYPSLVRNRAQKLAYSGISNVWFKIYEWTLTSAPHMGPPAVSSAIFLVDCTFMGSANNIPSIGWSAGNYGYIHLYNRFDLTVYAPGGAAVEGAHVVIRDKDGTVVYEGDTGANGTIPTQELPRYSITRTIADGIVNTWYTPYTVTVSKSPAYLETAFETSLGERVKQTVTLLPLDAQYITDITVDVATPPAITVDIETPPVITVDVHIGG